MKTSTYKIKVLNRKTGKCIIVYTLDTTYDLAFDYMKKKGKEWHQPVFLYVERWVKVGSSI